jgi:hypothetical protein
MSGELNRRMLDNLSLKAAAATVAATMVWCGVVWCGVVWCGVVWCGVVWCGVVWCGVVWCGVVWCGTSMQLIGLQCAPAAYMTADVFIEVALLFCCCKRCHAAAGVVPSAVTP